jgi:hypothetical protein
MKLAPIKKARSGGHFYNLLEINVISHAQELAASDPTLTQCSLDG